MIIFGTRGVTTTPDRGSFYCPSCGPDTDYAHKRVKTFFTLYFIPLIPLGTRGEYVECQTCFGTYKTNVLEYNPQAQGERFLAEFHYAVGRVMVLMLLADGEVDPQEVAMVSQVFQELTGQALSETEVHEEIEQAKADGRSAEDYLKSMADSLNDKGKETVIRAALSIANADGHLDDSEMQLLHRLAKVLQVKPERLTELLA